MDDLVAMARAAQRDDRLSTGALYGELADEIERLREDRAKTRSDAINEFCANAEIAPLLHLRGLPADVKAWRLNKAVDEMVGRRKAARAALAPVPVDP